MVRKRGRGERTYVLGRGTLKPRSANGERRHKPVKMPSEGTTVQK